MGSTKSTAIEVQALQAGIDALRQQAKGIETIVNAEQYARAGTLLKAIRDYKKDVKQKLDPFVTIAKRAYDQAREERDQYIRFADAVDSVVSTPMEDFKRKEREAAAAEERRINEERRRKAEAEAAEERKRQEAQAEADRKRREKEIAEAKKAGE